LPAGLPGAYNRAVARPPDDPHAQPADGEKRADSDAVAETVQGRVKRAQTSSGETLLPESVEGRYEIIRELGHGGAGVVYLARDNVTGVVVALKRLKDELALAGRSLRRFQREVQAAWRVTHPGVVRIHDLVRWQGGVALSMEYVEGETLEHRLERAPALTADELRLLALDLARALAAAHRQGIVHRDLKPANIILRASTGRAVITDFGVSRLAEARDPAAGGDRGGGGDGDVRLTQDGTVIGTPLYMPLEQLTGQLDVGPTADVYALGVLLYEAATGRLPHHADTMRELLETRRAKPPPLRDARPDLPASLRRVIERCLEPAPGDRFADAVALRDALDDSRARRRRTLALSLAAALIVVVAATALFGYGWRARRSQWKPRVTPLSNIVENLDQFDLSPDGKWIVLPSTRGRYVDLWLIDLTTGEWRQLTNSPAIELQPHFADHGRSIVYNDGALQRLRLDDPATHEKLAESDLAHLTVAPDQEHVIFAQTPRDLARVALEGGPPELLARFDDAGAGFYDLAVLRDGKRLAVSRLVDARPMVQGPVICDLWIVDLADPARRRVIRGGDGNCQLNVVPGDDEALIVSSRRSGAVTLWKQFLDGRQPIQLTPNGIGDDLSPAISPDGKTLYYENDVTFSQLFELRPNDSWRRITNDLVDHQSPALDPGGTMLLYLVDDRSGGGHVAVTAAAPNYDRVEKWSSLPSLRDATLSPDGTRFLATRADGKRRFDVDIASGAVRELTVLAPTAAAIDGVSWSPERAQIVSAGSDGAELTGEDGGHAVRLVAGSAGSARFDPRDPRRVAFIDRAGHRVRVIDVDGGAGSSFAVWPADALAWSSDGNTLFVGGGRSITSVRVSDGSITRVAGDPADQIGTLAVGSNGSFVAASLEGRTRLLRVDNFADAP
jgi:serine/threonine protein kinase